MAHQLEIVNNQASMFYVGETPWHKLGQHFLTPPSTDEALVAAGLNWEVQLRPLFNEQGRKSTHKEIFRCDTNTALGVVGPSYHPLQNTQAFGFFQPLVESGLLAYETAGVLQDGKKVWILAKVAGDPMQIAKDDIVDRYVLLSNSHDGTMAIRVGYTPIRVVCNNTLTMALGSTDSQLLRIRHTTNATTALAEIQKVMKVADASFEATAEQFRRLTQLQVNEKDLDKYIRIVFDLKSEEDQKRESKILGRVIELFEGGRGNDLPSIKGTAWAAYQGVTEYLQYEAGKSEESRLNSLWFGQNAARNKKALNQALIIFDKAA